MGVMGWWGFVFYFILLCMSYLGYGDYILTSVLRNYPHYFYYYHCGYHHHNYHHFVSLYIDPSWRTDPLSYFSFQASLHECCNKGHGMCYPVCGMVQDPLLLANQKEQQVFSLYLNCYLPYVRRHNYPKK